MSTLDYLKKYQPILYQVFSNAKKNHKLGHAYLLHGEIGAPLFDIALYLAQSLICDKLEGMACEECRSCKRMNKDPQLNNYLDLKVVDGGLTGSINKEAITELVRAFSQSAIEDKGIQIYIINQVELMKAEDEAAHALLKFLEEPHPNIFAFLTTNNIERVIPTIVSRSQVLRVCLKPLEDVISEALDLGIEKSQAIILAHLFNEASQIKLALEDEKQARIYALVEKLIETLNQSREAAIFYLEKEIIPYVNDKNSVRFFLDLFAVFCHLLLDYDSNGATNPASYGKILTSLLQKVSDPAQSLYLILDARAKVELNITIPLILDHLIINFTKGINYAN